METVFTNLVKIFTAAYCIDSYVFFKKGLFANECFINGGVEMSADKYTCPKCQGEVNYGDKFCGKCGFRFGEWGGVSSANQTESNTVTPQTAMQSSTADNSGGSFLGTIMKWAVILVVVGGIFAFASSFFGVSSPQEAIKKGDKDAMETFYSKAKDKGQAKTEMGNAILEEAYRILDGEEYKNSARKQLEAQNKLMNVTEFFVKYSELQDLQKMCSAFNNTAVANSKAQTAEDKIWKNYNVSLNSNLQRIDGYVLNKVQNSNSQYQCVHYEYLFGNAIPQIDQPICVLDFGNNRYVQQGVQTVYGVADKEADFVDRAGFKTKMMIYKVVDEAGYREIRKAKRLADNKRYEEENFKRAYPKNYFANGVPATQANAGTLTQSMNEKSSTNKKLSANQTPVDNGYVNGVGVNLREAPSLESHVIRTLDHDNIVVLEFTKDADSREWARVRLLADGTEGYIAKEYFKHSVAGYRKDTELSIGKGHIVGTDVIMRAGEARESDPIGTFNKNESVEILKYVSNSNGEVWVRVRRNNGDRGFVFGKYLQKD